MGYIYSSPWFKTTQTSGGIRDTESRYMLAWGRVLAKPRIYKSRKDGSPLIQFRVDLGKRQKMHAYTFGQNSVSDHASKLQTGDTVAMVGVWSRKPYYSPKKKSWIDTITFRCDYFMQSASVAPSDIPLLDDDSIENISASDFIEDGFDVSEVVY